MLIDCVTTGGVNIMKLGDKEVEYNPDFRFYITTRLSNPHYTPEISTKTVIVNFAVKQQGNYTSHSHPITKCGGGMGVHWNCLVHLIFSQTVSSGSCCFEQAVKQLCLLLWAPSNKAWFEAFGTWLQVVWSIPEAEDHDGHLAEVGVCLTCRNTLVHA